MDQSAIPLNGCGTSRFGYFSPCHALYLATRGGARALHLEDTIGSIAEGMEADVTVLDLHATPLLDFRMGSCDSVEEQLWVNTEHSPNVFPITHTRDDDGWTRLGHEASLHWGNGRFVINTDSWAATWERCSSN